MGMGVALCLQAQQAAVRALANGHFLGAKQQLEHFLEEADEETKGMEEAEALCLVCDYVLGCSGTADRMGLWVEEHSLSRYADVLRVLACNRLVREGRTDEAVQLFFEMRERGNEVPVPLAYPLGLLSDEARAYEGVLHRLAGEWLYDRGEYAKALPYLEQGEKTRTANYKLGMCHYRFGAWGKALAALTESVGAERDEMAQSAWMHAGIAALQIGERGEAQKAFRQASEMNASDALCEQSLYNYALTLHEQSSPIAATVMETYLGRFAASPRATPLSQCLTEVYMKKKDYSKALGAINKVSQADAVMLADKQKVLYNLAFQELSHDKVQDALSHAAQAVALGKQDADTYAESYYVSGDCNYRLGNYAQAATDLERALDLGRQTSGKRLKNHDYALYTLGYALFKQQKYNAAITQLGKVADEESVASSLRADAYNRMGDCLLNMRDYDGAYAHYASAKSTDHAAGDYAMLQQAYIEGLRGNYDKKVEIIRLMAAEYPTSSQGAKALYEQGRALVLSGKEDEAAGVFGSIAASYPQSEYAKRAAEELANMAANVVARDSIAAAQDSIAEAEAKAPVLAAQELYEAEQYVQAEEALNKAIDNGIARPYWLARAFVLLSDVYKAEGRAVEARQTLESLKASYKEEDDIQTMIEQRLH